MENSVTIKKVVNKDKTYVDKNGKNRTSVNYYVCVGDSWIPVRPTFSKGYTQLDVIAETVINGSK